MYICLTDGDIQTGKPTSGGMVELGSMLLVKLTVMVLSETVGMSEIVVGERIKSPVDEVNIVSAKELIEVGVGITSILLVKLNGVDVVYSNTTLEELMVGSSPVHPSS